MDGGAWWATVHGAAKSQTRLSDFTLVLLVHVAAHIGTSFPSVCLPGIHSLLLWELHLDFMLDIHSPSTLSSLSLPHPQHQGWGHDSA